MRREWRCELPGRTLFLVEEGSGPLVLMLHGITANAYVWAPVQDALADRFRTVAVDQRGHGRSDRTPDAYGAADYAADIVDLARALGGGPAIVLGHSLGARNGIEAGVSDPRWVRAVVAVDFVPFIEAEVLAALHARVAGGDQVFPDLAAITKYLRNRYPLLPPEAVERRARYGYRETGRGFVPLADPAAMLATSTGLGADLEPALAAVAVPVLLVRGALSRLVSPAAFAEARRLRPDLPAVEVAEADHYVPEERPAEIARLLRDFVADH